MRGQAFWIGSYTSGMGGGEGIYRVRRRPDGSLEGPELAAEAVCPSYLAVGPGGNTLYAVREQQAGGVAAYKVRDGRLHETGRRAAGELPCHVSVTADGGHLLIADYGSGTVRATGLDSHGLFTGEPDVAEGHGSGPDPVRQEGPHAHMAVQAPDGTVLTADLGSDLIRAFRLQDGRLRLIGETACPSGSGPRHLALHPSGHVYVVTELAATVLVLSPRGGYAGLEVTAESPAMAAPSGGAAHCAAIKISGEYVYTSTRGADVVTTHRVREDGAALEPVADIPSGGAGPRDLHVDGAWMHITNEHSDTVTTFAIGPDGIPVPTGAPPLHVPSPVCVVPA
ncbi:lactonase family protein [Streptomyces cucumeris]|uniref:lactonase family protein n=1 Tax=Streptomyces cucumeris TaxID=2962890 RepID=UPI003D71D7CB